MQKTKIYVDTSVFGRVRKFNAVNLLKGYATIDIRSPAEVGYGDDTQDV